MLIYRGPEEHFLLPTINISHQGRHSHVHAATLPKSVLHSSTEHPSWKMNTFALAYITS